MLLTEGPSNPETREHINFPISSYIGFPSKLARDLLYTLWEFNLFHVLQHPLSIVTDILRLMIVLMMLEGDTEVSWTFQHE